MTALSTPSIASTRVSRPPSLSSASTTAMTTGSRARKRNGGSTRLLGRDPHQQRPDQHHQPAERGDGEDHGRPARERDGADGLDAAHATAADLTSSTRSHGGPEHLHDLGREGRRLGEHPADRSGRDDLAVGEHHDLVGDEGHELDVVGGHQHRPARRPRARAGPAAGPAWRSSRGRGSARRAGRPGGFGREDQRQREGEPLALGQVARVPVAGDARDERVEELPGTLSPGRALLVDGLEVEQVRRRSAAAARPASVVRRP